MLAIKCSVGNHMRKIYVLESKYQGSNLQLHGLAQVIPGEYEVVPVQCMLRSRKKFFYPLYHLTLFLKSHLPYTWKFSSVITKLVLKSSCFSIECDSIIIAKTPPYEMPAALLSAGIPSKIIFIGEPRKVSRRYFHQIISTPSCVSEKADCFIDLMPVSFTYEQFRAARLLRVPRQSAWCILLGGDARGYEYKEEDWLMMIDALIRHAQLAGVRLIISSSPRTGKEAEQLFKTRLSAYPELAQEMVWWSAGDRKKTFDLMLDADLIVVTEDSASMVSEALNTRLPIVAICPSLSCRNSLTTDFVCFHNEKGRLLRLSIAEFFKCDIVQWLSSSWTPLDECWSTSVRRQLKL